MVYARGGCPAPAGSVAFSRNPKGEAYGSAEQAARRQVHPSRALHRDARQRGLRGRARTHGRERLDRSRKRHLLSPPRGCSRDKKAKTTCTATRTSVGASAALETAWPALRSRVERRARKGRG